MRGVGEHQIEAHVAGNSVTGSSLTPGIAIQSVENNSECRLVLKSISNVNKANSLGCAALRGHE